jgi:hypothetical protein
MLLWACLLAACCAPMSTRHAHTPSEVPAAVWHAYCERRSDTDTRHARGFASPYPLSFSSCVARCGCAADLNQTEPVVSKTPESRFVCREGSSWEMHKGLPRGRWTRAWAQRPGGCTRDRGRMLWRTGDVFGRTLLILRQQGSNGLGEAHQPRQNLRRPPRTPRMCVSFM